MVNRLAASACIAGAILAGCGGSSAESEAIAVLHRQADAVQREDIEAYMETMDPKSPDFATARSSTQELFDKYKLLMWVESAQVVRMEKDEADVRASIVTKRVEGEAFQDNKATGVHTLRRIDGQWRMVGSRAENVEYLR